eukprot:2822706-Rhodomonas_salina.1
MSVPDVTCRAPSPSPLDPPFAHLSAGMPLARALCSVLCALEVEGFEFRVSRLGFGVSRDLEHDPVHPGAAEHPADIRGDKSGRERAHVCVLALSRAR